MATQPQKKTATPQTPETPEKIPLSLSVSLIAAQYALKTSQPAVHSPPALPIPARRSVVILMSGIELAGKGEALMQLREWSDPRLLQVCARAPEPLQRQYPLWRPYVRDLPAAGELKILFSNWYGDLLRARMKGGRDPEGMSQEAFEREMATLESFEQGLRDEGMIIVKCWFDLSWKSLQKRLDNLDKGLLHWQQLHGLDWRERDQYDGLQRLRHHLGRDWVTIDSELPEQRDISFAHLVLEALQQSTAPVATSESDSAGTMPINLPASDIPAALLSPSRVRMEKELYKPRLKRLQKSCTALIRERGNRPLLLVLEGMDAAGKGGAIRRVVSRLDPREYQIHSISAPEPHELRHHYLWRFWKRLPDAAGMAIFDRSWYGRVLVERVEQYASPAEWQRAYTQINAFEQQLCQHGVIIVKIWLAISNDEQLSRFKARETEPHKHFKITPEDWRNREKWEQYQTAVADMLAHTNTPVAPWHVIATDDKYTARLAVLETLETQLRRAVERLDMVDG